MGDLKLDISEINLIIRLLYGLKFGFDKFTLDEFITSPIYGKVLDKCSQYQRTYYSKSHAHEEMLRDIRNVDGAFLKLKEIITSYKHWLELDEDGKKELVSGLFAPFAVNSDLVNELIVSRDKH